MSKCMNVFCANSCMTVTGLMSPTMKLITSLSSVTHNLIISQKSQTTILGTFLNSLTLPVPFTKLLLGNLENKVSEHYFCCLAGWHGDDLVITGQNNLIINISLLAHSSLTPSQLCITLVNNVEMMTSIISKQQVTRQQHHGSLTRTARKRIFLKMVWLVSCNWLMLSQTIVDSGTWSRQLLNVFYWHFSLLLTLPIICILSLSRGLNYVRE